MGDWLGVGENGLFNFKPSVRPVPLEVHIQASKYGVLKGLALFLFVQEQSYFSKKYVMVFIFVFTLYGLILGEFK